MPAQLLVIAPSDANATDFPATLAALLGVAPVAALLLPRAGRDEASYRALVSAILAPAQGANCAVLIEGEPALAKELSVDGLHVTGSIAGAKAAIKALKPDFIIGAGGVTSRHDAMILGELDVDYLMFGALYGPSDPEALPLAQWWARNMEIPSVYVDSKANAAAAQSAGCEFIGLSDSLWAGESDAPGQLAAIVGRLEIRS